MDIVYSILCHESPECLIDFLNNIFYFNKGLSVSVIIHSNRFMYTQLLGKINNKNVYLNPNTLDKRRGTIDIFRGHIENFGLCKEKEINMKYFIPLASNCYFCNFVTLDFIDNLILNSKPVDYAHGVNADEWKIPRKWQWHGILKNNKINRLLKTQGVEKLFGGQNEGLILDKNTMDILNNFIYKYNIFENVEADTVFEEYLFTSLYTSLTGKMPEYLCFVFWDMPNYKPTLSQVLACDKPSFKTVQRSMNCEFRLYFNKKTNNYA
jgi:hypothetical protein